MNTSLLLKSKIIKKIVNKFKKINLRRFDSLSTFGKCNEFIWNDKQPINHNIIKQPKS
jgi:hypothetical protein